VSAVVALRSGVIGGFHVESVVRAGLCTRFAADTPAIIEIDNAVLACEEGRYRTDLDARSIGAVVAPHHREQSPCVGKGSLFDVFDPSAVYANWNLMLGLARHGARMAADTLPVIDYEAKIHRGILR